MSTREGTSEASAPSEGVIRFDLRWTPAELVDDRIWRRLSGWREVLRRLGLVGRDPHRYDGFGFGNLSHRSTVDDAPAGQRRFIISGTQTGHVEHLDRGGWTEVESWDLANHRIDARGPVAPSSESTTHAAVYDADPTVRTVFHVHAPEAWQAASRLGLPTTPQAAEYGTAAMTEAVARLWQSHRWPGGGVFAMGGHVDGLVAFGPDPLAVGHHLLDLLARALVPIDN